MVTDGLDMIKCIITARITWQRRTNGSHRYTGTIALMPRTVFMATPRLVPAPTDTNNSGLCTIGRVWLQDWRIRTAPFLRISCKSFEMAMPINTSTSSRSNLLTTEMSLPPTCLTTRQTHPYAVRRCGQLPGYMWYPTRSWRIDKNAPPVNLQMLSYQCEKD